LNIDLALFGATKAHATHHPHDPRFVG
jgi:hypothetical protein